MLYIEYNTNTTEDTTMSYGEVLRTMRVEHEITLRELARRSDIDVAYLSRIERETIPPPQKEELLEAIADALKLNAVEAKRLRDLAAMDNKQFPKDFKGNFPGMVGIPMLLRTVANKKLTPDEIHDLIRHINDQY
jgi:Helix-turn-helix.